MLARDNASPAFRRVGDEAEKAGKKTSAFGSLTSTAMKSAAGAIAGIGIGALLGGAVRAASDLNETVNRTNVIFGQNAREVRSWAQDSARSFGLSERAALDAASGFGNMLTQLGFTADQALKASTNTVKLAADLGSFNNLDTQDVLDRISASLRGEYDSLQLLIPNINAARVEQEALALTGKSAAKELTAQEKATATLAIIQRDGAAAANDFAETSDGLANSQKILNAEWQNAQARLGALLVGPMTGVVGLLTDGVIPAFEGVVGVVGGAVDLFGELPGPVQAGVIALGAVSLLKGPVGSALDTIALKALYAKDAFAGATLTLGGLRKAGSGLLAFFGGPIGLAITGITVGLGFLVSALSDTEDASTGAADAQNELTQALEASKGAIDANVRAAAAKELQDRGVLDTLEELGIQTSLATDAVLGQGGALGEVGAELVRYRDARVLGSEADQRAAAAANEAWRQLQTLAGTTTEGIASTQQLAAATAETGSVMETSTGQTAQATEALEKWLEQLQRISADFIDPLATYKDLLSEKTQAERDAAEETAAATDSATDSWEDYVGDVSVSLDELAGKLQEQIAAHENWRTNIVLIAQAGGAEFAQILANMGEEGVTLTQQMVDAIGTEEFPRLRDLMIQESRLGGEGAAAELDKAMQVMALVGAQGSKATAQGIARELGIGVADVLRIARGYGVNLAAGINPILQGLGKAHIALTTLPGFNAGGGLAEGAVLDFFAKGGFSENHVAQIAPAGAWRMWAEPETGGEAYIPLAPAKRGRSRDIWREVGNRLGVEFREFAFGGISDVPRPSSTAPYRFPISTPADATMQREYDETVAWLKANLTPPAPALGAGIGWQAMMAALRTAFPGLALISGFRPGSITATGNLSYHALGRAVDVPPSWDVFNWLHAHYPNSRELIFSPAGNQQIWNGAPHFYNEPTRGDHWDHVHWAMANGGVLSFDQGGLLPPGLNLVHNGTGQPERVVGPGDGQYGRQYNNTWNITTGPDKADIVRAIRQEQHIREVLAPPWP